MSKLDYLLSSNEKDMMIQYFQDKKYTEETKKNIKYILALFLININKTSFLAITRHDVEMFLRHSPNLSVSSKLQYVKVVKIYLDYLVDNEIINYNPVRYFVKKYIKTKTERLILSDEEIKEFNLLIEDITYKAVFNLIIKIGLSRNEVIELTLMDKIQDNFYLNGKYFQIDSDLEYDLRRWELERSNIGSELLNYFVTKKGKKLYPKWFNEFTNHLNSLKIVDYSVTPQILKNVYLHRKEFR